MSSARSTRQLLVPLALAGLLLAALPATAQNVTCLPTCRVDDGKFLAISGTGLVTLSDTVLDVTLSAEADTVAFDFGVFDGDSGVIEASTGRSRWDVG
ncbi:MAG: hypothetical protein GY708_10860, partial [Actinomycetia bacterium]|nr:hypothetical protein [Actinomycetes bacterium]